MAESTVSWFVVREKYCSLAEKVRLISQTNRTLLLLQRIALITFSYFFDPFYHWRILSSLFHASYVAFVVSRRDASSNLYRTRWAIVLWPTACFCSHLSVATPTCVVFYTDVMFGHVLRARYEHIYGCTCEHGRRADSRRQIDTRGELSLYVLIL